MKPMGRKARIENMMSVITAELGEAFEPFYPTKWPDMDLAEPRCCRFMFAFSQL